MTPERDTSRLPHPDQLVPVAAPPEHQGVSNALAQAFSRPPTELCADFRSLLSRLR